jgi:hypothetical protein
MKEQKREMENKCRNEKRKKYLKIDEKWQLKVKCHPRGGGYPGKQGRSAVNGRTRGHYPF